MRPWPRKLAAAVALVAPAPAGLARRAEVWLQGSQQAFAGWWQAFSLLPGVYGADLRRAFYRTALPQFGEGACLAFGVVISHATARIGRYEYARSFCIPGDVTWEDNVQLGSHLSPISSIEMRSLDGRSKSSPRCLLLAPGAPARERSRTNRPRNMRSTQQFETPSRRSEFGSECFEQA